MAMVTRCPACMTVFRVGAQQLQAQGGMVRCGRCMTVFDGFKALSTAPDASAPETAPAPPAPSPEPTFKLEPVSATELAAAAAPEPDPAAKSGSPDEARDFGPAPEQLTLEDHLFLEDSRAANARSARLWAVGAALLLLALAAQAVYVYRGELAAYYPGLRPHLARMCDAIRCTVFLPQRPRLISIEASDLQATDAARPSVIQVTVTVRNHAGYDLGFPALDLVLTNTREHTLARRIFLPRDYLEPGRDVRAGIPANAELTMRLDLDTGDLNPAGFRLDLLEAPPP